MLTYYWQLWRREPRAMIETYLFKARRAFMATVVGSVTSAYSRSRIYGNGREGTLARIPRVQQLVPLALIFAVACMIRFRRHVDLRLQWMFWTLIGAAMLVYLEAAIILSIYQSSYHAVIVMGTLVTLLTAAQWVLEYTARVVRDAWRARTHQRRRALAVLACVGGVALVVGVAGRGILAALARQLTSPPVVVARAAGIVKPNETFVVQLSRPAAAELLLYSDGRVSHREPVTYGQQFPLTAPAPGSHELHVAIHDDRWKTVVLDVTNFRVAPADSATHTAATSPGDAP
jgi:hypothetical protein